MLKVLLLGCVVSFLMISCSAPLKLNNQYSQRHTTPPANVQSQEAAVSARSLKSYTREKHLETVLQEKQGIEVADVKIEARKMYEPTQIQVKYASLINILPGMLTNVRLLEAIDDWYGTRYRYGGTTKSGIDCSAFTKAIYKEAFGIDLPRTAREQYRAVNHISSLNLKEGDLLFFNTTGGISHVGMYLGNNKFVHASTGRGVAVSDLDESYYSARFLGAGRLDSNYYAAN